VPRRGGNATESERRVCSARCAVSRSPGERSLTGVPGRRGQCAPRIARSTPRDPRQTPTARGGPALESRRGAPRHSHQGKGIDDGRPPAPVTAASRKQPVRDAQPDAPHPARPRDARRAPPRPSTSRASHTRAGPAHRPRRAQTKRRIPRRRFGAGARVSRCLNNTAVIGVPATAPEPRSPLATNPARERRSTALESWHHFQFVASISSRAARLLPGLCARSGNPRSFERRLAISRVPLP